MKVKPLQKIQWLVSKMPFLPKKSSLETKAVLSQISFTFVASLAIAGLVIGVRQSKILQPVELDIYDQMVKLSPQLPADPRLLIIEITEDDIRKQNRWPLSDETINQLINTVQQYDPKVIGLDLFRDVPHPPGSDKLTQTLAADNIIAVKKLNDDGSSELKLHQGITDERAGFADIPIDFDNVLRRYLLYARVNEKPLYSFALRVSLKYLNNDHFPFKVHPEALQIGSTVFEDLKADSGSYQMEPEEVIGWQILLKYRSDDLEESGRNVARKISLTEVLQGKLEPSWVKDKIVLIGTTAPSEKDMFATPYSQGETINYFMPGVVIHAQMVSQILSTVLDQQQQFCFFPQWGEFLWIWGWCFIGGIVVWRFNSPQYFIGIGLMIISGLWGFGFLVFTQSGWIPVLPPILGLIATGGTVLIYKFVSNYYYDSLTYLPNRRFFVSQLQKMNKHQKADNSELTAVYFLDIDRFKVINEGLGHEAGDFVLLETAQRLQGQLNNKAQLARVGGDEFAIWLNSLVSIDEATEIANYLQQILNQPFFWKGQEIYTSVSIGIAFNRTGAKFNSEELLRDANIAMYQAKNSGKVHYEMFASGMREQVINRLQIETDLRRSIKQQEFQLFYQPIISLKTGKIAGVEALVRWKSVKRGFISPGEFIPIAEETGLIIPLGEWILQEACSQMRQWHQQFSQNPPLFISVNLSGRQFSQPNLVQQVQYILETINLERNTLKLEITESMMMNDVEAAIDLLRRLKDLGLRLSIDDFGTGYSNLSYLHRFPIDTLKIDQSFVRRMNSQESQDRYAQIVRTVIMLGHNLELDVIAEGIETEEQMHILKSLGCEYGQGYYFAKPLPSPEVTELLKKDPQWLTFKP
ncbi:diguanylate cyclase/phosphodiesterase with Chase sensor [Gloeothece citriformis PCC 7424]|uniref:Diguanylate cyclase/phosphodiesterase with Chase sensor n=1 Tax=Gloeothece citriformis (strain PCC 7424) TaxID=65393 RepID=B7KDM3_GLOC7|nr:EAL domain-containing protein [Gloeothece citriformis]ACK70325.1 diguanylate cyclase/phosphodiesterase with Chase sensor [Gloeothece citriformis PCC 7424]